MNTQEIAVKIAIFKEGDRVRVEYTGTGENPAKVRVEGIITIGIRSHNPFIHINDEWDISICESNNLFTSLEILDPPEPEVGAIVVGIEGNGSDIGGRVLQRFEDKWYMAGSPQFKFYWSEIAHKVKVVKV